MPGTPLDPNVYTKTDFNRTIELAWSRTPYAIARSACLPVTTPFTVTNLQAIHDLPVAVVIPPLRAILATLSAQQLIQWDAHCERALMALDTQRIHSILGGNADTFLARRGAVLALGEEFYDLVLQHPELYAAGFETECIKITHLAPEVYFGKFRTKLVPITPREICRESFQNKGAYDPTYLASIDRSGLYSTKDGKPIRLEIGGKADARRAKKNQPTDLGTAKDPRVDVTPRSRSSRQ